MARKYRCSRSWVVAEALADALGIDLQRDERYESLMPVKKHKVA